MKTNADNTGVLLPLKNRIDSLTECVYDENFQWQKLLSVLKIQMLPTNSKTKKIVSSILVKLNELIKKIEEKSIVFHTHEYVDVGEIFNLGYSQEGLAKVIINGAVEREQLERVLKIELLEYKLILDNYNLINEVNYIPIPINTFEYLGNLNELTDILNSLKKGFVSKDTNPAIFRSAFGGKKPPKTKIVWTESIEKLNYFIKMMKDYEMIADPKKQIWEMTKSCFSRENIEKVNAQTLRSNKNRLQIEFILSPYRRDKQ